MLTVPWSTEPEHIHNGTLEEYEKALARVATSVDLAYEEAESGQKRLTLNCHALPANALAPRLGAESPFRVSIAAWRIQPVRHSRIFAAPDTWVPCTDDLLSSLEPGEGKSDHLQLRFTEPEHERTRHFVKTRDLALMVRISTRTGEDAYDEVVYMLTRAPGSGNPVIPMNELPKGDVQWRDVLDPVMRLVNP